MPNYTDVLGTTENDPLIPDSIAQIIVEDLPKQSVMLSRARRVPMTTKQHRQPVLASLPSAYWVNGETGLKQTTKATWENKFITAEELAAIVVVPDSYFDDSSIPLWDTIRPLLVEAIGQKVDEAILFGADKPASWPAAIVPGAIAAGNTVEEGFNDDLGADVASVGEKLAKQGYAVNGFASAPGLNWRLIGLRDENGQPIYHAPISAGQPGTLYGLPLNEVLNGAWDAEDATIVAADWSKFVIGVRQDISFKIFDQGVISDAEGKVLMNLMQQDSKAIRVVFRVGYQVGNTLNRVAEKAGVTPFPAGVVVPDADASA